MNRQRAGFDRGQFKNLIERTLRKVDFALCSKAAVNLLLGTAAQESGFGTFFRQLGGGPALGVFQMEPGTFDWLRDHYKHKYSILDGRAFEELEWDLQLAIVTARLRYWIMPDPLPPSTDSHSLGAYWKKHYNTIYGAGTVGEFVINYKKYVAG